jgi:hypothetical protein
VPCFIQISFLYIDPSFCELPGHKFPIHGLQRAFFRLAASNIPPVVSLNHISRTVMVGARKRMIDGALVYLRLVCERISCLSLTFPVPPVPSIAQGYYQEDARNPDSSRRKRASDSATIIEKAKRRLELQVKITNVCHTFERLN